MADRMVTASEDKTARVSDAGSGQLLVTLNGHQDSFYGAVFSPNGKRVVTGGADKTVRVSIDRRSFKGQLGVELPNQSLQRQPERFRPKAGANDNEKAVVGAQGVRIVNRLLGYLLGQPRLFHRTDHSDHGEYFGIVCRFRPFEIALAESAGVGLIPREVLVHDANPLRPARIPGREETPFPQREAHRGAVVGAIRVISSRRFARPAEAAFHRGGAFAAVTLKGAHC